VNHLRRTVATAIFAGLLLGPIARAQTARLPDAPASDSTLDNQPIHRDSTPNSDYSTAQNSKSSQAAPSSGFDTLRVVIALGGVVGLIFLLRSGVRRIFPGAVPHRSSRAMQVLCRLAISPRQHLLLVQVGKRLIVVGDGGAQLNPLCEIASPEEVEAIVAQVREESASSLKRFDLFFGKARKPYTEEIATDEIEQTTSPQSAPSQADQSPDARFDPSHELVDPALAQTRDELSGLTQKVRDLAKQLGGS
jgi:flagellar biogenesis protein FliO